MTRTKLFSYRRAVFYKLVREYKWREFDAKDWIDQHIDYVRAMYKIEQPHTKTAKQLNEMKNNGT